MRDPIAERDKTFFWVLLLVGGASAGGCIACLLSLPAFAWLYIAGIAVMGASALLGFAGLCLPKYVLIVQGSTLLLYNGFRGLRKREIAIADLLSAGADESGGKDSANGNIILTVRAGEGSEKIVVVNVKNRREVAARLHALMEGAGNQK